MTHHIIKGILASASGLALIAGSAYAADNKTNTSLAKQYEDGANITISGTISNLKEETFTLNNNGKDIKVEFDDWTWNTAAAEDLRAYLKNGERVVVSGEVDKDWFSKAELEADNIYFEQKNRYFYVVDTNPAYGYYSYNQRNNNIADGSFVTARGQITSIDGSEFMLSSRGNQIKIDTGNLTYSPFDSAKGLGLKVGDSVYVHGEMEKGFFEGKEVDADYVVKVDRITSN